MNDPDNTDYIHTDNAFDYVIENMSHELIEYVLENHYDEIRDSVFQHEALLKHGA